MHFRGLEHCSRGRLSSKLFGAKNAFVASDRDTARVTSWSLRNPSCISTIGCRAGPSGSVGSCWWDALEGGNYPALLASLSSFSPVDNCPSSRSSRAMMNLLRDPVQEAEMIHRVAAGLVASVVDPSYCPPWVAARLSGSADTPRPFYTTPLTYSQTSKIAGWRREGGAKSTRRRGRSRSQGGPSDASSVGSERKQCHNRNMSLDKEDEQKEKQETSLLENSMRTSTRDPSTPLLVSERSLAFSVLSSMSDSLLSSRCGVVSSSDETMDMSSQLQSFHPSTTSLLVSLCALCVAENDNDAVGLSMLLMPYIPEAVGCALIAYCYTSVAAAGPSENTIETHWKSLWRRTRGEDYMNRHHFDFPLPLYQHVKEGLYMQAVQSYLLAWQVHCALAEVDAADRISFYLSRAVRGAEAMRVHSTAGISYDSNIRLSHAATSTSSVLNTVLRSMPIFATLEWVSDFPEKISSVWSSEGITSTAFHWVCAEVLSTASTSFSREKAVVAQKVERDGPRTGYPLSFAVSVHPASSSAKVQVTLLHYLMFVQANAASSNANVYRAVLHEVTSLWGVQNIYAIASSLLPSHSNEPSELERVMVGRRCEVRARRMEELMSAIEMTVCWLCTGQSNENASPAASAVDSLFPKTLLQCQENVIQPVPFSWRWGQRQDVEQAVSRGTMMLIELLSLCSNREGSLPSRKAVPLWRLKLAARAPVRSHKYELLPSEIPHGVLSTLLRLLLRHGFIIAVSELAVCLVNHGFIDIRAYPSSLLGSLKLAVQSVIDEKKLATNVEQRYQDAAIRLVDMYRQRRTLVEDESCVKSGLAAEKKADATGTVWRAFHSKETITDPSADVLPGNQPKPMPYRDSSESWSTVSSRVAVIAALMKEREVHLLEQEEHPKSVKFRSGSVILH